jgi:hypothetical protein
MLGCGGSSSTEPATATTPSNVSAQPELSCKAAVEQSSTAIKAGDKDITMAIGECDQHEWPRAARECVGAAHTSDALVACATTYNLGTHGIFSKSMSTAAAMKAMEDFRDKICACKDTPCVQGVSDEMAKWSQDMAKNSEEPPRMSEEETKRATEIGEEMGKCMQKAMGTATPSP